MTPDADETIILETALAAPPSAVWRALTEPALLARWLGAADIDAKVGKRFALPAGAKGEPVACEVIEVEAQRLLSYRWREGGEGGARALDTVVTWILDPTPDGGTRLRLVHDGFPIVLAQPAQAAMSAASNPDPGVKNPRRRNLTLTANDNQRSLKWAA